MKLADYLAGMEAASTAAELEAAIQAPFEHDFRGRIWSRICKVRKAAGRRIIEAHPHGQYVPLIGVRRYITLCGETYGVGYGQNSTGERYVWHDAEQWARDVHMRNGFSARASNAIWSNAFSYPHRALRCVEEALAGKLPDPRLNRLIPWSRRMTMGRPVRVHRRPEANQRTHRPCKCGTGWLWDWGCGWDGAHLFINWRCDRCPRVYTEYVTNERLTEIGQRGWRAAKLADRIRKGER